MCECVSARDGVSQCARVCPSVRVCRRLRVSQCVRVCPSV